MVMPRIVICHGDYGCDTGCCGHRIEVDGERLGNRKTSFFAHPDNVQEIREWAEEIVRAEGCDPANIDWLNSIILID
jgi:hypothetical protein